jgi:hypothetical protein
MNIGKSLYSDMPLVACPCTPNRVPGKLFEDRGARLWATADVLNRFDPNLGANTGVLNPRSGRSPQGIDTIPVFHDSLGRALRVGMSRNDQSGAGPSASSNSA